VTPSMAERVAQSVLSVQNERAFSFPPIRRLV
jgi:hypothetical protein